MAGDAIEVRESIEAKGDADDDVVMADAIDAKREEVVEDADAPAEEDADADAEGELDADGEPDEELDADADADADGEPDDGDSTQRRRDLRELLNLIDETQSYLSNYQEEYVMVCLVNHTVKR
jgi:chromatin structure-remodeling complex subunit RSC1/2